MDVKPEDPKERPRASVSLDRALNEIGFGPYQVLAFLLAGVTALACGTDIAVFPLIADSLHSEWGVDGVQFALLPSTTAVSNILGGVVYGYLCDSYGRVWPYVLAMLNISIFSLASAFSPNFVTFLCLRLIVSFGITGGTLILYAALVEVLPVYNRGKVLVLVVLVQAIGICGAGGLAWWLIPAYPRHGWRYMIIAYSIPSMFVAGFRLLFPFESPRFLVTKKRDEKAYKVLSRMAKFNGKKLSSFTIDHGEYTIQLPDENTHSVAKLRQSFLKLVRIFKKVHIRTTVCLSIIVVTHTSAYYSSAAFIPSILHKLVPNSYFTAFIGYLGQIPGVLLMSIIVEWEGVGRLHSLRFFTTLVIATLILFAFVQNDVSIPVLTIFLNFGMVPLTALVLAYISEAYPTDMRGSALAYFNNLSAFFGLFIPFIGGYATDVYGRFPWLFSTIWAAFYIVVFVVSMFLKKETLRKNLVDQ